MEIDKKPPFLFSIRFLMGVIIFFGYCLNYMQKIDMSISIVCMVNQTAVNELNKKQNAPLHLISNSFNSSHNSTHTIKHDTCAGIPQHITKKFDGPFVWPKSIQGLILSAYFYGYILTQIPGGWLSFRFGGRIMLGLSMGIGSLITILIPFCARWNYKALFVCLFFTGAAHGAFWPSVSSFWAFWAPAHERSRLIGMSSSGAKVGNIIALSLGSVLCVYGFDGGWPSIFYLFGIAGVTWSIIFFFIATDSPDHHKFISQREKIYVLEETKKAINARRICQSHVPWKKILTSKACYSVFIGHFAHNWGNYLFLTQTPTFLKDVLKFDIKSNGFISSIPYIAAWIATNSSSILSDKILKTNKLSRTNVRRLFSALGLFLPAAIIIGLSFISCKYIYLGVTVLALGVASDSMMTGAGYLINMNDIAGPYAGIVFGISNTFATLPGIISPYIAGLLTKHQTQGEWQIVFLICALVYTIGGILDLSLLDAELQPWAKIDNELEPEKNEKSSNKDEVSF